jgi:hypothetical protein
MDSHEHACAHHHHPETAADAATCGGTAACADPAGCADGCQHELAMPTTDERVGIPANDLATLLDLVEAFAGSSYDEDGAYSRSSKALASQAPRLVAAREALLESFRQMAGRALDKRE